MLYKVDISIRHLAEFMLRNGSIDSRFKGINRGLEGSKIHRWLQKKSGAAYKAEVALETTIICENVEYHLQGRADGVILQDGQLLVDEIKTTTQALEFIDENTTPAYLAQAQCYAYILCTKENIDIATVQLRYCNVETMGVKRITCTYKIEELRDVLNSLLQGYAKWAKLSFDWKEKRNKSLQSLAFPFGFYRDGQRDLAIATYQACKAKGQLFACAPTGIGKTISTLFPSMKAMGEGYGQQIFYLTAKTITRQAAEDTLQMMQKKSPLSFRSITLTAKDKICFLDERNCQPEHCPYANEYYDKINNALYQILQNETVLSRDKIEQYAKKKLLCPYELSLDIAEWCDCVVCDYNYLFDPVVHLQRFFEGGKGEYIFLVDEAHNLVDRGRSMYSASLQKDAFSKLKKELPEHLKKLKKALTEVNTAFVALRKLCDESNTRLLVRHELPSELTKPLAKLTQAMANVLEEERTGPHIELILPLYFELLFYQKIAEQFGDNYIALIEKYGSNIVVRLYCLDPSAYLSESLSFGRASVLFSATLLPLPYYRDTLGAHQDAKNIVLSSPFNPDHMGLFIADNVSTKYTDRQDSCEHVAQLLYTMVNAKKGNYIAYFPSYSYMQMVHEKFTQQHPSIDTIVQQTQMSEEEREIFLTSFHDKPDENMLAFCVLGGIFSEGVDLTGERLIGTAIVGVGLPQIGVENDALRNYYDEQQQDGFAYGYQIPGMNRVLQAAGRVIRTEHDKGVVLLIDSRFTSPRYLRLFPAHWQHWQRTSQKEFSAQLHSFWRDKRS